MTEPLPSHIAEFAAQYGDDAPSYWPITWKEEQQRQAKVIPQDKPRRRITFLDVRIDEIDEVKAIGGARWFPHHRSWWIYADAENKDAFTQWIAPNDPVERKRFEQKRKAERKLFERRQAADYYQCIEDERRERWKQVYPDRPYPADEAAS